MIPPIFVQNVYVMYIKISCKYHRIPDTQSHVITKVYDFLGQPSYIQSLLLMIIINDSLFLLYHDMPNHTILLQLECINSIAICVYVFFANFRYNYNVFY